MNLASHLHLCLSAATPVNFLESNFLINVWRKFSKREVLQAVWISSLGNEMEISPGNAGEMGITYECNHMYHPTSQLQIKYPHPLWLGRRSGQSEH